MYKNIHKENEYALNTVQIHYNLISRITMSIARPTIRRCLRWTIAVRSENTDGDSAADRLPCQFCCGSVRTSFQSETLESRHSFKDTHDVAVRCHTSQFFPSGVPLTNLWREAAGWQPRVRRGSVLCSCVSVSVRRLSLWEFMSGVSEHSRPNVQSFITLSWSHDGKKATSLQRRRVFRHFCYYD